MTNKEIGEKIRAMRLSRGMTQEELADAIGMSPSAVAMYEAGRRRPKDDVAEALADTFNVPKWSIYYRENEIILVDTPQSNSDHHPAPSRSPEWRNLSEGLANMEQDNPSMFMSYFNMFMAAHPEYFNYERIDDDANDTES